MPPGAGCNRHPEVTRLISSQCGRGVPEGTLHHAPPPPVALCLSIHGVRSPARTVAERLHEGSRGIHAPVGDDVMMGCRGATIDRPPETPWATSGHSTVAPRRDVRFGSGPGVETPGYLRWSLRDRGFNRPGQCPQTLHPQTLHPVPCHQTSVAVVLASLPALSTRNPRMDYANQLQSLVSLAQSSLHDHDIGSNHKR